MWGVAFPSAPAHHGHGRLDEDARREVEERDGRTEDVAHEEHGGRVGCKSLECSRRQREARSFATTRPLHE